jgi:hypothetical protein
MSPLHLLKIDVTFKIIIILKFNSGLSQIQW